MFNKCVLRWTSSVKILVLLALCAIVSHTLADESPVEQHQPDHATDNVEQHSVQKRTWKSLQGGWGKRNPSETTNEHSEFDADYYGYPGHEDNPADYGTNDELDRLNKYLLKDLVNQHLSHMDTQYEGADDEYPMEKRAWNKMSAGWGKRVNGPGQWNKFRGAWGKREPGWNNLKGLWGKRSEKWNKLSSSWGKRDTSNSNSY